MRAALGSPLPVRAWSQIFNSLITNDLFDNSLLGQTRSKVRFFKSRKIAFFLKNMHPNWMNFQFDEQLNFSFNIPIAGIILNPSSLLIQFGFLYFTAELGPVKECILEQIFYPHPHSTPFLIKLSQPRDENFTQKPFIKLACKKAHVRVKKLKIIFYIFHDP